MHMVTVYNKETGEATSVSAIDAKEAVASGHYTDVKPGTKGKGALESVKEKKEKVENAGAGDPDRVDPAIFNNYTSTQLKEFCKEAGVRNYSKLGKHELIAALAGAGFDPTKDEDDDDGDEG